MLPGNSSSVSERENLGTPSSLDYMPSSKGHIKCLILGRGRADRLDPWGDPWVMGYEKSMRYLLHPVAGAIRVTRDNGTRIARVEELLSDTLFLFLKYLQELQHPNFLRMAVLTVKARQDPRGNYPSGIIWRWTILYLFVPGFICTLQRMHFSHSFPEFDSPHRSDRQGVPLHKSTADQTRSTPCKGYNIRSTRRP